MQISELFESKQTLMAAEMSVETRFLDQLVQSEKFEFLVTRLALSWEREGVWKMMLFDKQQP